MELRIPGMIIQQEIFLYTHDAIPEEPIEASELANLETFVLNQLKECVIFA